MLRRCRDGRGGTSADLAGNIQAGSFANRAINALGAGRGWSPRPARSIFARIIAEYLFPLSLDRTTACWIHVAPPARLAIFRKCCGLLRGDDKRRACDEERRACDKHRRCDTDGAGNDRHRSFFEIHSCPFPVSTARRHTIIKPALGQSIIRPS